jgi:plasmid stabilization system protein ParE
MTYVVRYSRGASDELADIWTHAPDRNAVTAASDRIDKLLASDPYAHSESRARFWRVIMVGPLTAHFVVSDANRNVRIASIDRHNKRPPRP